MNHFWAGLAFIIFAILSLAYHLYCGLVSALVTWYLGCRAIWRDEL